METLTVNQNSISHVWYVKEHERTGISTKTPLQDIQWSLKEDENLCTCGLDIQV